MTYEERRSRLILALRTLRDAGETLQRGDGGGRFEPGSRALIMPAAWHAGCNRWDDESGRYVTCIPLGGDAPCASTYDALLDALGQLQKAGPRHYLMVRWRYLESIKTTRELVNRAGRYFETTRTVRFDEADEPHYLYRMAGPLPSNAEVLQAVAQPKEVVAKAKEDRRRMVLVRAIVETWDARVERRPLETGLDFLQGYMPRELALPREVVAA